MASDTRLPLRPVCNCRILAADALGPQSEFTSLIDDGEGSDGPMETKTHTHGEDRCHSTEA
jgi:hypothetical protein